MLHEEHRKIFISFNSQKVKLEFVKSLSDSRTLILPATFSSWSASRLTSESISYFVFSFRKVKEEGFLTFGQGFP